jgi:hypothetical protein
VKKVGGMENMMGDLEAKIEKLKDDQEPVIKLAQE